MKRKSGWFTTGFDFWMMGLEAQQVIAMRLAKISAGGPGAATEANLMLREKMDAMIAVQGLTDGKAQKYLHRKVSANRKRLSSGR